MHIDRVHSAAGFLATRLWGAADLLYKTANVADTIVVKPINKLGDISNQAGHFVIDTVASLTEQPEDHPDYVANQN